MSLVIPIAKPMLCLDDFGAHHDLDLGICS